MVNARFLFVAFASIMMAKNTQAQGCVAVRHMACAGMAQYGQNAFQATPWQANIGYRYFNSYKHFVGDHEQTQRVDSGTQVINDNHSFDLGLSYQVNPRLSLAVNLPYSFNYRSSLYEHYGNSLSANPNHQRFSTEAHGIGDARVSGSLWLLNLERFVHGNFSLGLGLKLPTGNAGATDYFHRKTASGSDSVIIRPVDQSIQLGDGGWGINLESQGFLLLPKHFSLFYNGFYLFNPRTINHVPRSGTISGTPTGSLTDFFSVPDQFMFRGGIDTDLPKGITASLGGRLEGIPAYDALGGSSGFRRPGYIVSVEPGATFRHGLWSLNASLPVAMYRNRIKSFADDRLGKHGDAAFADYLVNVNISRSFSNKPASQGPSLPILSPKMGL